MAVSNGSGTGPLEGLRIVELSHERCAWAAKLCADMGAEVIVVEPAGGSPQRGYGPFFADQPGPERSLWWWHYNTSKLGVVIDLETAEGRERFARLAADADVVIEAEDPGRLAALGVDHTDLRPTNERLVWVSVTPFGRDNPRSGETAVTDLTVLAGGGPVWSCGYDDHSLPPVRGGGNQGYQMGSHFAVMSLLTALLYRDVSGQGQHVDVSMHAAANVTTEFASYSWLVAGQTVQRQTGRHAMPRPTGPTQVRCADGVYANTGVPPRTPAEFKKLREWLEELGFADEFEMSALLELGSEFEKISLADIEENPLIGEVFGAGRDAVWFIAERLSAYDYFYGSQQRGMAAAIVYSPDEVLEDPHFVARGWPAEVEHPELGRTVTYPGVPIRFTGSPASVRHRAPLLGEHDLEFP